MRSRSLVTKNGLTSPTAQPIRPRAVGVALTADTETKRARSTAPTTFPAERAATERKGRTQQEANEAIVRPATGSACRRRRERDEPGRRNALYELSWMRTIASQMKALPGRRSRFASEATSSAGEQRRVRSLRNGDHFPRADSRLVRRVAHRRVRRRGEELPETSARASARAEENRQQRTRDGIRGS